VRTILLSFLLPVLLISCSAQEQPITKEEAVAFAQRLQTSIEKGHSQLFDSIFVNQAFADRIAKEAGDAVDKSYVKGLTDGLKEKKIGREMLKNMGTDATYEFLHHYEKDKHQHLLFRMYSDAGINYHDMELVKYDDHIGIADMFIYLSGENISKTFIRTTSLLADHAKQQSESKMLSVAKSIQEIRRLVNAQEYEKANALYEKLPAKFKEDKALQLMNLSVLAQLDQEKYKKALDVYNNYFGTDPAAQFGLFDSYFLNKDYDKALNVIDVLDGTVKDPVLNYYRALIYTRMNDRTNTIKCLEALYKQKPDFANGVLELIANYIEAEEDNKAESLLAAYRSNKKFDQQKLENLKYMYPDFAALSQL
jgi:hypothetical protein